MASRQLTWGLRAVNREVKRWRQRAQHIPNETIRQDALAALSGKRPHLDGAALFWTLPRRRNMSLLHTLVRYEIILEFLDNLNERAVATGHRNGRQLHLALVEAVDIDCPISDYYLYHPLRNDGGFLRSLVEACRVSCVALVSYGAVRALLVREATRAGVLALNHDPDPARRDAALRRWASQHVLGEARYSWFELAGAATSSLTVHMLLSQAAEPSVDHRQTRLNRRVYFPGVALLSTMLDSYVDQCEDLATNHHSYIGHYECKQDVAQRLCEIICGTLARARTLRRGHRHVAIVAAMIALYLSDDNARAPNQRRCTAQLARAGGPLTRLLIPILRLWRVVYDLRRA
jgi:tetraprenyl-beta-curcumene synthase